MNTSFDDKSPEFPDPDPMNMSTEKIWTVSGITSFIKSLFDEDPDLQKVAVRGEVTNLSRSSAGHIYFSMKDAGGVIKCVAFKSSAMRLKVRPEEGREIIAKGRISVWPAGGSYQLYVEQVEDVGMGALWIEFEKTRKRLQAEGLFDEEIKRPLPVFPRKIGLVTSPDGAALRDMLRIFREHAPYIQCILSPSLVQGETAPPSLIAALDMLEMWDETEISSSREGLDLIIIGRGGGSFEDLACFNDEKLARRIRGCRVPVISAVGHEVDFTIADFVADIRAATPTQAAAIAAPDVVVLADSLLSLVAVFRQAAQLKVETYRTGITNLLSRPVHTRPAERIEIKMQNLDLIRRQLSRTVSAKLSMIRASVESATERLRALDPNAILSRGYSLAFSRETGRLIRTTSQVEVVTGAGVDLRVSDGTIKLIVE